MFLKDDKKKVTTLILSKLGKPEEKVEEAPSKDGVEQDSSMPLEACADELLQAVEQKSSKGIVEALKHMFQLLQEEQPEQQPEEPKY